MNDFQLPVEKYLDDESLYIIDTISEISSENPRRSKSIIPSYINNPTDIMVKVGSGIHFVYKNNPRFRSVLDSSTTLLAYNDNKLIIRVLKAYLMRIYEAGGTSIITYTEDSADRIIETMLKSIVDNIIRLDSDELTVEAMKGVGKRSSPYKITEKGIVL